MALLTQSIYPAVDTTATIGVNDVHWADLVNWVHGLQRTDPQFIALTLLVRRILRADGHDFHSEPGCRCCAMRAAESFSGDTRTLFELYYDCLQEVNASFARMRVRALPGRQQRVIAA